MKVYRVLGFRNVFQTPYYLLVDCFFLLFFRWKKSPCFGQIHPRDPKTLPFPFLLKPASLALCVAIDSRAFFLFPRGGLKAILAACFRDTCTWLPGGHLTPIFLLSVWIQNGRFLPSLSVNNYPTWVFLHFCPTAPSPPLYLGFFFSLAPHSLLLKNKWDFYLWLEELLLLRPTQSQWCTAL